MGEAGRKRGVRRRGCFFLTLWLMTLGFVLDPLIEWQRSGVLEFMGRRYQGRDALAPRLLLFGVPVSSLDRRRIPKNLTISVS